MSGRVYLIDDDVAVQRGVAALLKAAGYDCSCFGSAECFLEALSGLELPGSVALVDVCMPGMRGPQLQVRLNAEGVGIPIIVMTTHGDVQLAVKAMRDGAVDFLEKPFDVEELTAALDRAFGMTPPKRSLADPASSDLSERINALTPRERQVLRELVDGRSNKEIARDLNLSPRTVEVHRRNLIAKMQASSFAELVRMAVAAGLCD